MKSIYRPIGKFLTRRIKGEKDTNEQYLRQKEYDHRYSKKC